MANFLLTWNPQFNSENQVIQYKLSSSGSYIDFATVSSQVDTYLVTGLLEDTLYDFRVKTSCDNTFTPVIRAISITCPNVVVTKSNGSLSYSFNDSGLDLDRYIIELWKDGSYFTQQILFSPFSNPLEGTFTGLETNGVYKIRLKAYSGDYEKVCDFSGAITPLCVTIDNVSGIVDESGTVTINLISFNFNQEAHENQTVQISYRLASDPDIEINYTALPDALVNPFGVIISPSPYNITVPETSIVIKVTNSCGDSDFQKTFTICEPVSLTANIEGQCNSGYIISPDGTYCYKEDIQDADCSGGVDTNKACHYSNTVYNQFGTIFYKPNGYNLNGTYTTAPARLETPLTGGSYLGLIWGNPSSNTTDGRLNKAGVWLCGNQSYTATPLGFSKQIIIPESKYYYIGFGADNYATLKLNGVTIVSQDETALNTQYGVGSASTFKWWHVYPVFLNAGVNYLELIGTNISSIGIMGCEVYNATEAQLLAITTTGALTALKVFTTEDVVDNTGFDTGNCNCDDYEGYSLIYDIDSSSFKCKKILTQTPF